MSKSIELMTPKDCEFYLCMVYGAKWAHLTGHDVQDPPSYDEFSALVDQYDLLAVFADIKEVMQGDRQVVAKPAKKAKAGA